MALISKRDLTGAPGKLRLAAGLDTAAALGREGGIEEVGTG